MTSIFPRGPRGKIAWHPRSGCTAPAGRRLELPGPPPGQAAPEASGAAGEQSHCGGCGPRGVLPARREFPMAAQHKAPQISIHSPGFAEGRNTDSPKGRKEGSRGLAGPAQVCANRKLFLSGMILQLPSFFAPLSRRFEFPAGFSSLERRFLPVIFSPFHIKNGMGKLPRKR